MEVGSVVRVGVIFPGQGSQVVGMGADVVASSPAAAALFGTAKRVLGYDLLAIAKNGPEEKLRETRYSQPAIFVANVALRAAVGDALAPVVTAGHSFGELCSLTIANALPFESALALVNERALAMQHDAEQTPGGMSAVLGLDPDKLRAVVAAAREKTGGRVTLATFNAPGQIVISGDLDAVTFAGTLALEAGAKRVVPLNVSGAWHSELMIEARERFAKYVTDASIVMPTFTVISNVDARPYEDVATIKKHLVASVTEPVMWDDTANAMLGYELDLIVEFGASPVLSPLAKRLPKAPKVIHVGDAGGVAKLLETLEATAV